jgi:hypothetical protein
LIKGLESGLEKLKEDKVLLDEEIVKLQVRG